MITRSEQINELAAALAKAQGEMTQAELARENTHFKSRYATLASTWDACRGPLSKNGLSVFQSPTNQANGTVLIQTILLHSSGQFMKDEMEFIPRDKSPQSAGSAISYGRRYMLQAFVGIAAADKDEDGDDPDEGDYGDDDGNNAQFGGNFQDYRRNQNRAPGGPVRPVNDAAAGPPVIPRVQDPPTGPAAAHPNELLKEPPKLTPRQQALKDSGAKHKWNGDQIMIYLHARFPGVKKFTELSDVDFKAFHESMAALPFEDAMNQIELSRAAAVPKAEPAPNVPPGEHNDQMFDSFGIMNRHGEPMPAPTGGREPGNDDE